jgi:hypothetical protein
MESRYDILLQKLDRFIRRYYKNQIIKGFLLGAAILISYFLLVTFTEYKIYFSVSIRTVLFFLGAGLFLGVIIFLVLIPLLKLFRLTSTISHKQAAEIISNHFPHLNDQLLNTLELGEKARLSNETADLIIASINQRVDKIQLLPFQNAINFRDNRKYLKYLIPPLFLLVLIFFLKPGIFTSSGERLIHYRKKFDVPVPFVFQLQNDSLEVEKGGDFVLNMELMGDYIPDEVYCCYGDARFLMNRPQGNRFTYTFRSLNNSVDFYFQTGKFRSKTQTITVINLPSINEFTVKIKPPAYTGQKPLLERNLGDLSIPQGSDLTWYFKAQESDSLAICFEQPDTLIKADNKLGVFDVRYVVQNSSNYQILISNSRFNRYKMVKYHLNVIRDQYPEIKIVTMPDSLRPTAFYYKGIITDDYGFSDLRFKYSIDHGKEQSIPIPFRKNMQGQEFYFAFDFASLDMKEGTTVHYYFEVKDNDGIHGPKSSKTQSLNFLRFSAKQLYDLEETIQDSLNVKMEKSVELSRSIQKDILRLQENQIQNPGDEWQRQQMFQEIQEKRNQLEDLLNEIRKENQERNQLENSFGSRDSLLLDKQKEIEDLLSKVMDEEMQQLMEEFNQLQQDFDSEKLNKLGEQLKLSFSDLNRQMDRNLELLKRHEMEGQFKKLANRLEQLSERHKELSDSVMDKNRDEKKNLEEELKQLKESHEDYQKLIERNEDLKQPFSMEDLNPDFGEIKKMMDQSRELLQSREEKKASRNMKKTAQNIKKLASRLNSSLEKAVSAQVSVDIDALMRLLTNLINFSFDQEDLIAALKVVDYRDPRYQEINQQQSFQQEKYKLLQDSLLQLSARTPQIAVALGPHIFDIESDLKEILDFFQERQKHRALVKQQEVLTQTNDLAVLLSEVLRNLLNQMANAMPGDQMGDRKGPPMPSLSGMKQQQQSLKDQLQKMIQEMKKGGGKSGRNQRLSKMLKHQEMFRKSMKELLQKGGVSNGTEMILKDVMKMIDQTEREIANFSINSNTLFRQNRILTRLLEAENAEKQKGMEQKRESREGNNYKLSNPKELFEYKRVRINYNDNFYQSNVKLLDYYNKLYLDYMIKLNND